MNLIKKILKKPESDELKEVDALEVWVVTWKSRQGGCSYDVTKEFEAFTNKDLAEEYAESLRNAFKLIRHTSENRVKVYKQDNEKL